jgi:membrane associated rhomboid family serine protease
MVLFGLLLSGLHALSVYFGVSSSIWGIRPRQPESLAGIVFHALAHGDILHLVSNISSLMVLGWVIWNFYPRIAWPSLLMIWPLSGLGVWLFGVQSGPHIGASTIVYGFIGLLLALAVFRRSLRAGMIAVVVAMLYGGSIGGLFPNDKHISWEGHLSGLVVGFLVGFVWRNALEPEEVAQRDAQKLYQLKLEAEAARPKTFFLPRDVFEKTMAERAAEEAARQQYWLDDLIDNLRKPGTE